MIKITVLVLLFVALSQVNCRTAPKVDFPVNFFVTDKESGLEHKANYSTAVAAGENIPMQLYNLMLSSLSETERTPESKYYIVSLNVFFLVYKNIYL